ncbi:hypothetical protein CsSME_00036576 [Camellia sinensis var. sinensis]
MTASLLTFLENDARTRCEEIRRSSYIEIAVEKIRDKFLDHPIDKSKKTREPGCVTDLRTALAEVGHLAYTSGIFISSEESRCAFLVMLQVPVFLCIHLIWYCLFTPLSPLVVGVEKYVMLFSLTMEVSLLYIVSL